jgi:hypothetical protein
MEIAKGLWQLSYAMLIFAGYLLFIVFVAPFGFGVAAFVSAWNSFRGRSYLSATIAVFAGILLEGSPSGFGSPLPRGFSETPFNTAEGRP